MPAHGKQAHFAGLTEAEHGLFCFLRLHPDVAATYGITTCKQGCTGCQGRKTCAGVNGKAAYLLCVSKKKKNRARIHTHVISNLPHDFKLSMNSP